eukprot:m.871669 g.871669  ORF g.871669 m.871669 type:complete len:337 (+) comp59766_c0_seq7:1-1011(+)
MELEPFWISVYHHRSVHHFQAYQQRGGPGTARMRWIVNGGRCPDNVASIGDAIGFLQQQRACGLPMCLSDPLPSQNAQVRLNPAYVESNVDDEAGAGRLGRNASTRSAGSRALRDVLFGNEQEQEDESTDFSRTDSDGGDDGVAPSRRHLETKRQDNLYAEGPVNRPAPVKSFAWMDLHTEEPAKADENVYNTPRALGITRRNTVSSAAALPDLQFGARSSSTGAPATAEEEDPNTSMYTTPKNVFTLGKRKSVTGSDIARFNAEPSPADPNVARLLSSEFGFFESPTSNRRRESFSGERATAGSPAPRQRLGSNSAWLEGIELSSLPDTHRDVET